MAGASREPLPGPQARATILVVDDEVLIRMMVADQLRNAGYLVIEAASAHEALDVLSHDDVEVKLVFSDIRMSGTMDGVARARAIRSEYSMIKVVLTSGHLAALDWIEHDGFFAKPYDAIKVIHHIKALLG